MPERLTVRVDFKGPFFTKDPTKTLRANTRDMLDALALEGQHDVKLQIVGRAGSMRHYTGHTTTHVIGRTESLSGRRWQLSAVVSASTAGMDRKEAIRTKAAAAGIERRWHPFRRTAGRIRRAKAVINANLTKGIE